MFASAFPPLVFHSLSLLRRGPGAPAQTYCSGATAAASDEDIKYDFHTVASFHPNGAERLKWFSFATFCQAVTQDGVGSNKCERRVNQRPALPGKKILHNVNFAWLFSAAVSTSFVSSSGRGRPRFTACAEMSC